MKRNLSILILLSIFVITLPASAQSWNIDLLASHFDSWGLTYGVVAQNDYAYVGTVDGFLRVIDISNPSDPGTVASFQARGFIEALTISGDFVYAAIADEGLQIIDISNHSAIAEAGYFEMAYIVDVAISGDYAYAIEDEYLRMIDISNLSYPQQVAEWPSPEPWSSFYGIAIQDDYAYIADGDNSLLHTVLISESPPDLSHEGSLNLGGYPLKIAISGNYAYVTDPDLGRLIRVDISNASDPEYDGSCDGISDAERVAISISGDYAFVTNGTLVTIDLSNLEVAHTLETGGGPVNSVAVTGDIACVTDFLSTNVIDVSNLPTLTIESSLTYGPHAFGLAIDGDLAYVGIYNSLEIYDISNPAALDLLGSLELSGLLEHISIYQNHVYVFSGEVGVYSIDIGDPANPSVEDSLDIEMYPDDGLHFYGNYAYCQDEDIVRIINITDPGNMSIENDITNLNDPEALAIDGNYLYVADSYEYLVVYNLLNQPDDPDHIGNYSPDPQQYYWDTGCIDVSGGYAYLGFEEEDSGINKGLWIADVSNPAAPTDWVFFDADSRVEQVIAQWEEHILIGDSDANLRVLNVSDPDAIYETGNYDLGTIMGFSGVAVSDTFAYITDYNKFCIFDCYDAVGIFDIPGGVTPLDYKLHSVFPNPFNPTTTISFDLPVTSMVDLKVYDIYGRIVGVGLAPTRQYTPGTYQITFDGSNLTSGVYLYRLQARDFTASGKMVLMK